MTPTNLKFAVAKRITLPLLKIEDDSPRYLKIDSEIFKAKDVNGKSSVVPAGDGSAPTAMKQPPELMNVTNLETGEVAQVIVNTVLGSTLRDAYPNDGYKGKCFEIIRHKISGGKKYAKFSVTEITLEADAAQEAPKANGSKKR